MSTIIYTIYKATNIITGKVYIGFAQNLGKRLREHHSNSFNQNDTSYNTYFHRAIRKYGRDTFIWEPIYQSLDGKHCLKEMEPYFILEYDSFKNGYNMTIGGDGILGLKHTEETKRKLSGRNITEETKNKISKATRGRSSPNKGTHWKRSEETKLKMSLSKLGKKRKPFTQEHKRKLSIAVMKYYTS